MKVSYPRIIDFMPNEKLLLFCTCGARAKDTEGVQCIGPRMGIGPTKHYVTVSGVHVTRRRHTSYTATSSPINCMHG